MLKCAIIYLQGSGGNLLARSLALNEKTIPFVPKSDAINQCNLNLASDKRLESYNNWLSNNWDKTEKDIDIWYHHGIGDFVQYEKSNLLLVDRFHSAQFEYENNKKVLWTNISAWEHLIFIKYLPNSLDTIIKLAQLKRTDMYHVIQIHKNEIDAYNRLLNQYENISSSIFWEEMQSLDNYVKNIRRIATKIDVDVDLDMVATLWTKWKIETDKCLNNKTKQTYNTNAE